MKLTEVDVGYHLYLSEEKYMFNHYKPVEKNCVFIGNVSGDPMDSCIIYEIGSTLDIIKNPRTPTQTVHNTPIPRLAKLLDCYGKNNVMISSSTPLVKYQEKWLGCGHIKIKFRECNRPEFLQFMSSINISQILQHGKYIYFIFLYEVEYKDGKYKVTRISNPFIPTYGTSHLPYVMAFPAGICQFTGGKLVISYGEGDCRCKLLVLNDKEVSNLLKDANSTSSDALNFYFFSPHHTVQHYGYFNSLNCGDDAFKFVFNYLKECYYPNTTLEFRDPYNIKNDCDVTILGGGDVINNFFVEKIPKDKTKIAVGVGVPYEEYSKHLSIFDEVVMRNRASFKKYQKAGLIKSGFACPDLTFILPRILERGETKKRKIGVSLISTYYNEKYLNLYQRFLDDDDEDYQAKQEVRKKMEKAELSLKVMEIQDNIVCKIGMSNYKDLSRAIEKTCLIPKVGKVLKTTT
jgi:hypothetical protein